MGLGTAHTTTTTSAKFIPQLWSDETLAAYKQKLVLGNLVTAISFKGKKGDTCISPCLHAAMHLLRQLPLK